MDDSRQDAGLTYTKQFLRAVFMIIKCPVQIYLHFFFSSV